MSPDGFVQMAIVYGYYGLYGDVVAAYEPVLTKVLGSFFFSCSDYRFNLCTLVCRLFVRWLLLCAMLFAVVARFSCAVCFAVRFDV